jgi:hypothetical protein
MKNVLSVRLNEVRQFTRLLRMSKKKAKKLVAGRRWKKKSGRSGPSSFFFFLFLKKRDGQLVSLEEMGSLLPTTTSSFESPQSA